MTKRKVKTAGAALARTSRPLADAAAADGLENLVAGLGTSRDKMSYSSYGMPRFLQRQELENMYRGAWLPKRIVNTVADDMTRAGRKIQFDDETEDAQFAIEATEKRLGVWAKVNEALRWGRLYGGALILIGTKDRNTEKPLDIESIKQGDLRYLHVVDRWRVSHDGRICSDLDSPNFGLPESYILAESSVRFHHTRVLRFNGQKLPYFAWRSNNMWDDSELQHVLDVVTRHDTAAAGVATMLFEANVDVIKSPDLADLLATKDGEAKALRRFQTAAMMKSFNRVLLLDTEEEWEKKSNQFANLDKIVERFMIEVSGASDIPMTRLFGRSAGGLNATGDNDIRNYYDMISAKQEAELRPQIERLDQILLRNEFGLVPKGYGFQFESLWQQSDLETSEVELNRAQRDEIYLTNGVIDAGIAARELRERQTFASLTDADVRMAASGAFHQEPDDDELGGPSDNDADNKPAGKKD